MSNYVQSTNFATKDNLSSGDPLKIVKGTEINTEFANIAIAVATKADLASPTFTGSPVLPTGTTGVTQSSGNNSTALATTAYTDSAITAATAAIKAALHPVGSIYINATDNTNPATLLGFGTWSAFGAGRVPVGFDSTNSLFDTAEETGGSANSVVVSHSHTVNDTRLTTVEGARTSYTNPISIPENGTSAYTMSSEGGSDIYNYGLRFTNSADTENTSTTGSSGTNANYQPYITVYMWKRVS